MRLRNSYDRCWSRFDQHRVSTLMGGLRDVESNDITTQARRSAHHWRRPHHLVIPVSRRRCHLNHPYLLWSMYEPKQCAGQLRDSTLFHMQFVCLASCCWRRYNHRESATTATATRDVHDATIRISSTAARCLPHGLWQP